MYHLGGKKILMNRELEQKNQQQSSMQMRKNKRSLLKIIMNKLKPYINVFQS